MLSVVLMCLASPLLTILLACVAPTLQFISLNQKFYSSKQIHTAFMASIVFAIAVSVFSYFAFKVLNDVSLVKDVTSAGFYTINFLGSSLALFLFFVLSERFFDEIFNNKKLEKIVKASIFIFFVGIASFYSCILLNIVLVLVVLTSLFDLRKNSGEPKQILFDDKVQHHYDSNSKKRDVKLEKTPNIYLLLLESYSSATALKKLYNIDDSSTDAFLAKHNFIDFENVFSNSHNTYSSIANLLHGKILLNKYTSAYVTDILRENGYSLEFFDSQFYVFGEYMQKNDFANFAMSEKDRKLYLKFAPLLGQSKYLRKFAQDIDPFNTEINFEKLYESFKYRLAKQNNQPHFYALRFGADHVNIQAIWSGEDKTFIEKFYPEKIKQAQAQLQQIVELIIKKDPDALILAVGDHGGLMHTNIAGKEESLQLQLKACKVSNEDFALDMFGVRFAIKFPFEYKINAEHISHVNLFRAIFKALGANGELLGQSEPDISIYNKTNDIIVRNNTILGELEQYYSPELFSKLRQKFKLKNLSASECMLLALDAKADEKYDLFNWAISNFPDDESIKIAYMNALFDCGKVKEALEVAKNNLEMSKNNFTLYRYYNMMAEFYPQDFLKLVQNENIVIDSIDMHYNKALAHIKNNEKEEALLQFDAMMLAFPNEQKAVGLMNPACISLNNAKKSLAHLVKIKKTGNISNFWKHYTFSFLAFGYSEETILISKILATEHPTETWSWLSYAYALQNEGKIIPAINVLQQGESNVRYPAPLKEAIGILALRYGLDSIELEDYKTYAKNSTNQIIKFFIENKVIDKNWYKSQHASLKTVVLAPLHYVTEGIYMGLNPTPWFNSFYYMLNTPEVWLKGLNPFMHFIETGIDKLLSPSVQYNIRELIAENPALLHDKQALLRVMNTRWVG